MKDSVIKELLEFQLEAISNMLWFSLDYLSPLSDKHYKVYKAYKLIESVRKEL